MSDVTDVHFQISDPFTFLLSMLGIAISLFCILKQWFSPIPLGDKELEENLAKWMKDDWEGGGFQKGEKLNAILKDYEISNEEIGRRDNITLLTGTILITSSLIILGNAALNKAAFPFSIYAFASIGLFSIWLVFLHETAKKLNAISYNRIKAIEQALTQKLDYPFGIHSYVSDKTLEQTVCWLKKEEGYFGTLFYFF